MQATTEVRPKILLLDDDPDLIEAYQGILALLPSQPEIQTAMSGPRAMALLEAEPFRLLICDLRMPKMDGLQVLSIVRRKFPQLRTVALTSVVDEQFRSRAYALGVDLFWHKPCTEEEIRMFLECLESLLGQETEVGFRGIQSKSLMDIIQLECMSQSSSMLRIANGTLTGTIWIQDGEVIDAVTDELGGEAAFYRILSWRAGHFETLPAEPSRQRAILKSYNELLLESAQALDESIGVAPGNQPAAPETPQIQLSEIEGLEFVLALKPGQSAPQVSRGLESPALMAAWTGQSLSGFRQLGDRLMAGPLEFLQGMGPQRHVILATHGELDFCVGWKPSMVPIQMQVMMKKVLALWGS